MKNLVENSGIPVTAKIRVFKDTEKTLALVDRIVETGVVALAVHARTKEERPKDKADWNMWRKIADHLQGRLPLIANGDVFCQKEVDSAFNITGIQNFFLILISCSSVVKYQNGQIYK